MLETKTSSGFDTSQARRLDTRAVSAALGRLARAPQPPWLHGEIARRMAQRLNIILLKPEVVVDWWSFLGAGEDLLRQAYPKAQRRLVEPGGPCVCELHPVTLPGCRLSMTCVTVGWSVLIGSSAISLRRDQAQRRPTEPFGPHDRVATPSARRICTPRNRT